MKKLESGTEGAIGEIIAGVFTSVFIDAVMLSGVLPPMWGSALGLVNTVGTVVLILAMPRWGTIHLVGWIFGVVLLSTSGLIGLLEWILYVGIPIVVLIVRAKALFE